MLISSKTTLCQGCFQTFGGQCIYIYIYKTSTVCSVPRLSLRSTLEHRVKEKTHTHTHTHTHTQFLHVLPVCSGHILPDPPMIFSSSVLFPEPKPHTFPHTGFRSLFLSVCLDRGSFSLKALDLWPTTWSLDQLAAYSGHLHRKRPADWLYYIILYFKI